MTPLYIEKTEAGPKINFDPANQLFSIEGESAPENARLIYFPVLEWLEVHKSEIISIPPFKFNFSFDYLNSISLKYVYDILKKLENFSDNGCKVEVNWEYMKDDEEMKENGEEFARLVKLDFRINEKS